MARSALSSSVPATVASRVTQRRYFFLPDWPRLDARTMDAVRRAATVQREPADLSTPRLWRALEHPLASRLGSPPGPDLREARRRTTAERQAARLWAEPFAQVLAQGRVAPFGECLQAIASQVLGAPTTRRTGMVGTERGTDGRFVRFPRPDTIRARLADLLAFLRAQADAPPIFRAAVALVALSNCHPFTDGNGRTARVVFNLILAEALGSETYVPLYELGNRPWGSLTLFLRAAELHGAWAELFDFLQAALVLADQEAS